MTSHFLTTDDLDRRACYRPRGDAVLRAPDERLASAFVAFVQGLRPAHS